MQVKSTGMVYETNDYSYKKFSNDMNLAIFEVYRETTPGNPSSKLVYQQGVINCNTGEDIEYRMTNLETKEEKCTKETFFPVNCDFQFWSSLIYKGIVSLPWDKTQP